MIKTRKTNASVAENQNQNYIFMYSYTFYSTYFIMDHHTFNANKLQKSGIRQV